MTSHVGDQLTQRLIESFDWRGDKGTRSWHADLSGWFRDPTLLRDLISALADLHSGDEPTVVLGVESRGTLLGCLVAQRLSLGIVEVRKDPTRARDSDRMLTTVTPPDYLNRHLTLGFRKDLLTPRDRVLLVDDWIETGAQASAVHELVAAAEATWLGTAVIVDALTSNDAPRCLNVRSVVNVRDL